MLYGAGTICVCHKQRKKLSRATANSLVKTTDRKSYVRRVRIARSRYAKLFDLRARSLAWCVPPQKGTRTLTRRRASEMSKLNYFGTAILAAGLTCIPALAQTQPSASQDPAPPPTQTQPSQASPSNSDAT